uniref:Frizzled-10-B-like n=1 Tax=Phallusia mammillata TaxID=59560 RepID=A0A6F9DD75_9ASCI|nr:frizzled-10-B-like [Phallusia mammillata]
MLAKLLIALSFAILYGPSPTMSGSYELSYYRRRGHICEPIQQDACKGFNYNLTIMPNTFGHESQTEASARFMEFDLLLQTKCSPHLRFFLCTLHFPLCAAQVSVGIPACRAMCEEVRDQCSHVMLAVDKEWSIDCSRLPYKSDTDRLCMQPPGMASDREEEEEEEEVIDPVISLDPKHPGSDEEGDDGILSPNLGTPVRVDLYPENPINVEITDISVDHPDTVYPVEIDDYHRVDNQDSEHEVDHVETENSLEPDGHDVKPTKPPPKCKNPMKFHFAKTVSGGECLPRCDENTDVFFSSEDKALAYCLLTVFAFFCFISTAGSVFTFTIDSKRFKYPERPIIFLSFCYLVYSSAYLARALGGPESSLACMQAQVEAETDAEPAKEQVYHLVKSGLEGSACTAVFFLLYYFGMAAAAWWVILTFTWLLSAGFKWGHEAIEAYSFYFHMVAWSLPAAQTIVALVLAKVDGDELTGLCYVGNLEPDSLMYFVIIPLTFYLLMGTAAVIFGFGNLFKIRRVIKHQSNNKAAINLEKLMVKIGVFSVLYIVPVACVVAVNFYQYQNFSVWVKRAEREHCRSVYDQLYTPHNSYALPGGQNELSQPSAWDYDETEDTDHYETYNDYEVDPRVDLIQDGGPQKVHGNHEVYCTLEKSIPSLPIFAIKIFMSLVAGITSGMWVWNAKTLDSWRNLFTSCCKCRGNANQSSNETLKYSVAEERNSNCTNSPHQQSSRHDVAYSVPLDTEHRQLILPVDATNQHLAATRWKAAPENREFYRGCTTTPRVHKPHAVYITRPLSCGYNCERLRCGHQAPQQIECGFHVIRDKPIDTNYRISPHRENSV